MFGIISFLFGKKNTLQSEIFPEPAPRYIKEEDGSITFNPLYDTKEQIELREKIALQEQNDRFIKVSSAISKLKVLKPIISHTQETTGDVIIDFSFLNSLETLSRQITHKDLATLASLDSKGEYWCGNYENMCSWIGYIENCYNAVQKWNHPEPRFFEFCDRLLRSTNRMLKEKREVIGENKKFTIEDEQIDEAIEIINKECFAKVYPNAEKQTNQQQLINQSADSKSQDNGNKSKNTYKF